MDLNDLADMRRQYRGAGIDESTLPDEPMPLFARWLTEIAGADLPEPNAMVVSTAGLDGQPSSRTVLLKEYGADGFVFYTNYDSRKGRELAANPGAGLLFPWHALDRQVIVVGRAERVPAERTAAYFASRPYGSRIGAWASEQSSVIASREDLEKKYAELTARFPEGTTVPVPPFWGGFLVVPQSVEFWQGRENRLHDRLRYRREGDAWVVERLSP
ncbi:pyridoxamine 5'-phosphate oxidase [Yinghuangia seranimata]|uniref:pyridoxamine 5'-phosphate oxidase n=1 Tax=Yinghuangia seranimata TaxID=408067 RepID=UPI00248BAABB|nr:pyridoxamine 5'-phosphate oxidase [Yinghuangia seranimata]MDI2132820.1 pyridoxamine 5'-phosphate oxidase [Yinghuangia seranimata]